MLFRGIAILLVTLVMLCSGRLAAAELMLWRVADGQTSVPVVYLLGSIHMLPASAYPLDAAYEKAYQESRMVVFETDMAALSELDAQMALIKNAAYADGSGLSQNISTDLYSATVQAAEKIGFPIRVCDMAEPWFCAMNLQVFSLARLGYSPELGIDQHFWNKAEKDGKRLMFFEPVDRHMHLLTEMPDDMAVNMLRLTIRDMKKYSDEPDMIGRVWQQSDTQQFEQMLSELKSDAPAFYRRLLTDRNDAWLPTIKSLVTGTDNALVIVGAFHLLGDEGLVALLRRDGYQLTRLSSVQMR